MLLARGDAASRVQMTRRSDTLPPRNNPRRQLAQHHQHPTSALRFDTRFREPQGQRCAMITTRRRCGALRWRKLRDPHRSSSRYRVFQCSARVWPRSVGSGAQIAARAAESRQIISDVSQSRIEQAIRRRPLRAA